MTSAARRLAAARKAWAGDKRGLAALEFALIATPFFVLIFGLIEVCLVFVANGILDHAATEASRRIRTGEIQGAGTSAADFRTSVCDELAAIVRCDGGLRVSVQRFADFDATTTTPVNPINPTTGDFDATLDYEPGAASEIVVVRVFYEWELITPVITGPLANMSGNRRLLQSTVAFRNEPF